MVIPILVFNAVIFVLLAVVVINLFSFYKMARVRCERLIRDEEMD